MNVNSMVSKITKNIDKIGIAAGALSFGLDKLLANIQALPTKGHIPDIGWAIEEFFRGEAGQKTKDGIMLYIGGYAVEALGFPKIGKPLTKFAEGYVKGHAIQHLLYFSTHNDSGSRRPSDNSQRRLPRDLENPMERPIW